MQDNPAKIFEAMAYRAIGRAHVMGLTEARDADHITQVIVVPREEAELGGLFGD